MQELEKRMHAFLRKQNPAISGVNPAGGEYGQTCGSYNKGEVNVMTKAQTEQIVRLRMQGCGYTVIAKRMELSRDTVRSFCRRNGLAGRISGRVVPDSERCRECGKVLEQIKGRKHRVFCSAPCRVKWWHEHPERIVKKAVYSFTCAGCGKTFTSYGNAKRKYCSHACYIHARFQRPDTAEP